MKYTIQPWDAQNTLSISGLQEFLHELVNFELWGKPIWRGAGFKRTYASWSYVWISTRWYDGFRAQLYFRANEHSAKLLIDYSSSRGIIDWDCLPLSDLHIRREGAPLRTCGSRSSGKPFVHITLKFTVYESLVLFANTFIAMRLQDCPVCPLRTPMIVSCMMKSPNTQPSSSKSVSHMLFTFFLII